MHPQNIIDNLLVERCLVFVLLHLFVQVIDKSIIFTRIKAFIHMKSIGLILFIFVFFSLYSCQLFQRKNTLTIQEQQDYISAGKTITDASLKALSGEVMKALQEGGVQHAAAYCHLQASPLIDSLTAVYEARISRVSEKNRNPENKPDELDLTVIQSYENQLEQGIALQPHLEITADQVIYYSPILIANPACLLCHGEPGTTINQSDYDFIKTKYPGDLAVNYQMGQLRGVWKVEF